MTVATFQAVTATPPSATTGTLTVPWPTTHAVNDVGFLVVVSSGGGTTETLSTAAGFVLINTQTTGTGTAGVKISVYWCRATSTAMASPVVAAGTDFKYGLIATYRGLPTTGNPYATFAGNVKATASTSWASEATLAATSSLKYIVVNFVGHDLDSTAAAFSAWAGTGMTVTERFDAGSVSGLGGGIAIADAAFQGGATTVPAFTATVTSSINAGIRLALTRFPPIINTDAAPDGYLTKAYSYASKSGLSTAGNGTWSISVGSLPPGLTIDSTTGIISGTPTTAGSYSFTISVTDGLDTLTAAKSIFVTTQTIPFSDYFTKNSSPYYFTYGVGDVRSYNAPQSAINFFRTSSGVDLARMYRDLDGFVIGQKYTVTGSLKWFTSANTGIGWVGVDGIGQSADITVVGTAYTSGNYTFTATATTHRIVFGADATGGASDVYLGDFSVAPAGSLPYSDAFTTDSTANYAYAPTTTGGWLGSVLETYRNDGTTNTATQATRTIDGFTVGQQYTLSAKFKSATAGATHTATVGVVGVGTSAAVAVTSAALTTVSYTFTATSDVHDMVLSATNTGAAATDVMIDDVSVVSGSGGVVHTATATVLATAGSSATAALVGTATTAVLATAASSAAAIRVGIATATVGATVGSTAAAFRVTAATVTAGATAGSTAAASLVTTASATVLASAASSAPATLVRIATVTVGATVGSSAFAASDNSAFVTVSVAVGSTAASQAVWVATTATGATTNSTATAAATLATTSTVPATVTSSATATLVGITTATVTATAQATAAAVTTGIGTVTVGATVSTQLAAVLVELVLTNITVTATLLPRRWDADLEDRNKTGALLERDNTGTLLERTNTGTLTPRRWEGELD